MNPETEQSDGGTAPFWIKVKLFGKKCSFFKKSEVFWGENITFVGEREVLRAKSEAFSEKVKFFGKKWSFLKKGEVF
ncbi:hypothetical protein [Geomonas silvestris]|uniref:hypothetical protein n=1 Tax=Geomonas silvestris TaxID=2740184 RepID=UPI00161C17CD|nr:hypothetical protein [Geomonas silvestris]